MVLLSYTMKMSCVLPKSVFYFYFLILHFLNCLYIYELYFISWNVKLYMDLLLLLVLLISIITTVIIERRLLHSKLLIKKLKKLFFTTYSSINFIRCCWSLISKWKSQNEKFIIIIVIVVIVVSAFTYLPVTENYNRIDHILMPS